MAKDEVLRLHRLGGTLFGALIFAALWLAPPARADMPGSPPDAMGMQTMGGMQNMGGMQDMGGMPAMGGMAMNTAYETPKQQTEELTNLSIEQLLNLDVIPVDVLGTHTHLAHQLMLGIRHTHMMWNGNQEGTHSESIADVLSRYPVAHSQMSMEMDMFEAMYAPTDDSTYMLMLPYTTMYMDHVKRTGVMYPTYSAGTGDLALELNQTVSGNVRMGGPRIVVNAGFTLPTGAIDKTYKTPTNPHAPLEYMMQLGSGTVDLLPGITYLNSSDRWAWGSQLSSTVRLGYNSRHYRLGNIYQLDSWGYYKLNDWVGPSVRAAYSDWDNVHGADPEMNPADNPAFDPKQQAGKRIDLFFGINLYAPRDRLRGNRLSFEYGFPIYQNLDGLQVKNTGQWTLSYNYTFGS
jgi:hypothetical protein